MDLESVSSKQKLVVMKRYEEALKTTVLHSAVNLGEGFLELLGLTLRKWRIQIKTPSNVRKVVISENMVLVPSPHSLWIFPVGNSRLESCEFCIEQGASYLSLVSSKLNIY